MATVWFLFFFDKSIQCSCLFLNTCVCGYISGFHPGRGKRGSDPPLKIYGGEGGLGDIPELHFY